MTEKNYKQDFPLLQEQSIAYLDNAATTQRPSVVLEAEQQFYTQYNANPLRGFYDLGIQATQCYADSRDCVRDFIHAASSEEIIFTKNATEALNLVAYSYGLTHLKPGDELVVSIMEHHSNLLPWQMVAHQTGATLRYLECEPDGTISDACMQAAFSNRTKMVCITHVSNVLGRVNPIDQIVERAKKTHAVVVLDGAQSVPHMPVDVQKLGVDFMAFSAHKIYGPMGVGVLYGRRELLEDMPPFLTGGEMIQSVTREGAIYAELPHKFEAGTVNAAGTYGLQAAIQYVQSIGFSYIEAQEQRLTARAMEGLLRIPHVHVQGSANPEEHCGIVSFTIDGVHPHDVSSILDADGIAVRSGHHCAQPLLTFLGVQATTRASIAFYNTEDDIDRFLDSVQSVRGRMGYGE